MSRMPLPLRRYSRRKASDGSIEQARRAGSDAARHATAVSTAVLSR